MEISSKELYKGYPNELAEFLDYTKNIEYNERPNYDMLRKLFDDIMLKEKYNYDYIYDWTTIEEKESRKNNKSKTEPTNGDTSSNHDTEKKDNIEKNTKDNSYHIQRNNKILENYVYQESEVCCSSGCSIF